MRIGHFISKKFAESSCEDSFNICHTSPSYISVIMLSKCWRFVYCLRLVSKLGRRYIELSCCRISENGKIKLGRIKVRFVDTIFWDNGVLQNRVLRIDELGNSICWHFITVSILFCWKFTTSCFWYSLWHLE